MTDSHPTAKSTAPRARALKWAAALAMLAGLLLWIDHSVGWSALLRPWRDFPPPLLALLVGMIAASHVSRALRLYELYRRRLRGSFARLLRISVLHTTWLNLLPLRTGEAAFPIMMKHHFDEGYLASVARLVWLRVIDLWGLLWLGLLTWAVSAGPWAWAAALAGALPPLLLLSLRRRFCGDRATGRFTRTLSALVQGLPGDTATFARILGWTLVTWGLKLAAFLGVVTQFYSGNGLTLIPGIIAAEISNALPVQGIAGFGTYEAAMVLGGSWSPATQSTLLLIAVNLHLFILGCTLLIAGLALMLPGGPAARPQPSV